MKRSICVLVVLSAVLFAFTAASAAPAKDKVPCTICGYLVDKDKAMTTQYEGTTYYFCEAGCKAYFLQNPAPFAAGNDMDPVCGMTIKKAGSVEAVHNGRQIHFCSQECKDKYLANPSEYEINFDVVSNEVKPQKDMKFTTTLEGRPYYFVNAENKAAFDRTPDAYVYAECPVTGKVFLRKDAGAKTVHDGATYYFCCKGCEAKFKKDPKKYAGPAKGTDEGCTHEKGGAMKEGKGGTAEAGCSAKKTGACPMAKECKKS